MSSPQLSTRPYKGTRDFFPEEMRLRNMIFDKFRQTLLAFGYASYDGPMLEPFELYAAKSGEELVSEQLYSFEDRGGRKVAMRPEMTPTLARMVAARGAQLPKPIRWFSQPNLWRYERPQRGRLREHWQLNVDLLGVTQETAEVEIVQIAIQLLRSFGAGINDFGIQINHRQLMNDLFENVLKLSASQIKDVAKAIDKRAKISAEKFDKLLSDADCSAEQIEKLKTFLGSSLMDLEDMLGDSEGFKSLCRFFDQINVLGLGSVCHFDASIMRGLDYYTGIVFEVFDKHPDNRRALFGGGRYDNLVGMFGGPSIPGVGFGMGDVTFKDFLEAHNLLPEVKNTTDVMVGLFSDEMLTPSLQIASDLRAAGLNVESVIAPQKLGKQFQAADKKGIPYVVMPGPDEVSSGYVSVKNLALGTQEQVKITELASYFN